jgi:hypothetical protein
MFILASVPWLRRWKPNGLAIFIFGHWPRNKPIKYALPKKPDTQCVDFRRVRASEFLGEEEIHST